MTVQVSYGLRVGGMTGNDLVIVRTVNRSRHDVRVTGAGVGLQDQSGNYVPFGPYLAPGYDLPHTVPSRDSGEVAILARALQAAGIDLYRPMRGRVHLSTGEWIESKPTTLRSR